MKMTSDKKTQIEYNRIYKWIGLTIIIFSLGNIFIYDIYTRSEFMRAQTMEFVYGIILLGIYFYKTKGKSN